MRILHISSAQAFGGGERYLVDLANTLAVRGHNVYVAVRPNSPLIDKLTLPKQNLFTLPLRNALDAESASALAKLAKTRNIELVHAHMARDYPLAAYAARRNPGASLIVTRHVLFPLNRLHKFTLARVSRVIAVSHAVANALQAQSTVPSEKISVVHNGVDCQRIAEVCRRFQRKEFCRRWDLPETGLLVGSLGTLTPLKGHEDFLRAAAKIKDSLPEAFFVLSGVDGSTSQKHRKFLELLIHDLGLADRVRLIGWMDDVTELFCALDVFVSASHSESFGLAIVEAMAAGTAVVATETEGALEIIEEQRTGMLVPIGGIEAMAAAIAEMLADQEMRARLAADALKAVRERFSLERMVDETERIYLEALVRS